MEGPTVGVQWGVWMDLGWVTNLIGRVSVVAVGHTGWESTPATYFWWVGYCGEGIGSTCSPGPVGCSVTDGSPRGTSTNGISWPAAGVTYPTS